MDEQTPKEILALIQFAEEQNTKNKQAAEAREVEEDNTRLASWREEAEALFNAAMQLIPDVIRPFVVLDGMHVSDAEYYGVSWNERVLEFHIPELAPIAMFFSEDREKNIRLEGWIVAGVGEDAWDQEFDVCRKAVYSCSHRLAHKTEDPKVELFNVLLMAKQVAHELPRRQVRLDKQYETAQENWIERKLKEDEEKNEELSLFDAIKSDPVAVHLMKAFLMIRQERSMFEEQVSEANDNLYSMEDRWSRKAADLRRQAQDADRRAEEERNRSSDLESDLSKANEKINQTERGW